MTTTRNDVPAEIAARIVLGFVASRTDAVGESLIHDALTPHMTQSEMRAGLDLLLRDGKVSITRPGMYLFVEPKPEPDPEPDDRDIDSVIMAYAHGRGVAVEFDLNDVCALPMLGHVPVRRLTVALRELVRHEQLDVTGSRWCLPLPTGSDRALIDELAAWFDTLDPSTSVTVAVITHDFRSAPTHLLHVALDYLTTTRAISRVRPGTYMRNV